MLRKIVRKKLKAGFTMEASILVPIALLLLASVMTVVFMLHDRVILSTVSSYEIIDHADRYKEDAQAAEEGILEMLEKRLLTAKNIQTRSEEKADGISVQTEAEIDVSIGKVQELTSVEGRIEAVVNVSDLNRREQLVRYKTICDGLTAITGSTDTEDGE